MIRRLTIHRFRIFVLLLAASARAQTAPPPVTETITVTADRSPIPIGQTAKTVYTLDSAQLHDYPSPVLDDTLRQHAGFELLPPLQLPYHQSHQPGHLPPRPRLDRRLPHPSPQGRCPPQRPLRRLDPLERSPRLDHRFRHPCHRRRFRPLRLQCPRRRHRHHPHPHRPIPLSATAEGGSQDTSTVDLRADHRLHLLDSSLAAEQLRTAGYVIVAPQFAGLVDIPANVHSESLHTELGRRAFATNRFFLTGNLFNEARGNGTPDQTNATRLWRYIAGYDTPETTPVTARIRLFGSDEGFRQSFSAISPTRSTENLTRIVFVRTQELGATADATFHLKHLAFVSGADTRDIRGLDNELPFQQGTVTGLQNVTSRQRYTGGFGELLGEHGSWSGAASLRIDAAQNLNTLQTTRTTTSSIQTAQPDRTEYVLSPRLGLVRQFGPHANVHASAFRAFRSPTLNELYRTGQVGQETTLANAALQSERATGFEFGSEVSLPRSTSLQATYFWTEINRPVSAVQINQTATAITDKRENLGQIRSRGVELSIDALRGHPLWFSAGYQFADATVTSFSAQPAYVGNRIPQVPLHSATAQLHASYPHIAEATLALRASSSTFDDAANIFLLRRFVTLDLSGKRAITQHVDVTLLIQNLLNQRPDVSRTPVLTLGSGIFAEAGLRLRLGAQP